MKKSKLLGLSLVTLTMGVALGTTLSSRGAFSKISFVGAEETEETISFSRSTSSMNTIQTFHHVYGSTSRQGTDMYLYVYSSGGNVDSNYYKDYLGVLTYNNTFGSVADSDANGYQHFQALKSITINITSESERNFDFYGSNDGEDFTKLGTVGLSASNPTTTIVNGYQYWYANYTDSTVASVVSVSIDYVCSYSGSSGGGSDEDKTWNLVTSSSQLNIGSTYVLACNTYDATAGSLLGTYLGFTSSTFSDDKSTITDLSENATIFTLGGSKGAYTFTSSDGVLGSPAAKQLAYGSGTTTWNITFDSSQQIDIANTTGDYGSIYFNSSANRFTTYVTSSQKRVQLYTYGTASSSGDSGDSGSDSGEDPETPVTPADAVTLNKSTITLTEGNTSTITAAASGSVTWSSSNEEVVTVTSSGYNNIYATIKTLKAGSTTITATVGTASATCEVTVNAKPSGDSDVTFTEPTQEDFPNTLYDVTGSSATSTTGTAPVTTFTTSRMTYVNKASDTSNYATVCNSKGKIVRYLKKGLYYTNIDDVANYILAFNEIPVNYTVGRNASKSNGYASYGGYSRMAPGFYGLNQTGSSYDGKDLAPYSTLPYSTSGDYYELDVGYTWSNDGIVTNYASSGSYNRGPLRLIVFFDGVRANGEELGTSHYNDGNPVIFYTPDHYSSAYEYGNYEGGWSNVLTKNNYSSYTPLNTL